MPDLVHLQPGNFSRTVFSDSNQKGPSTARSGKRNGVQSGIADVTAFLHLLFPTLAGEQHYDVSDEVSYFA